MRNELHIGDTRQWAKSLPPQSIQTIVTSPPYFGLRSYLAADHPDKAAEMGSEPTPAAFVAALVGLFRDLRAALRDDGTLWLNLGDSYAGSGKGPTGHNGLGTQETRQGFHSPPVVIPDGLKPKDLIGIPWRVALALQEDGWYLRSEIIWHKPAPLPESVTDRPTRSHEHIFLLSKRPTYYYDADAIAEQSATSMDGRGALGTRPLTPGQRAIQANGIHGKSESLNVYDRPFRNKRDVWTVASAAFPGSHFATFPPDLIRPCILSGSSERGACAACGAPWRRVVERAATGERNTFAGTNGQQEHRPGASHTLVALPAVTTGWCPSCQCGTTETVPCVVADPFMGSGTTAMVCVEEGRDWTGCDLDERARGWLRDRLAPLPVARLPLGV